MSAEKYCATYQTYILDSLSRSSCYKRLQRLDILDRNSSYQEGEDSMIPKLQCIKIVIEQKMWRTPFGSAASDHIAATQAQLLGAPIHNLLVIHLTPVHLRNGMLGLQRATPTNIVPIGARDVRTFSYV